MKDSLQPRLTGSKLETPITAPMIATATTPPAAMLSKKFLREGDTPDPAASATSGITIEAVNAAAVSPVTAFSFKEACTSSLALDLDFVDKPPAIDGLIGSGLRKDWELGSCSNLFWDAEASGIAIETEAIFVCASIVPRPFLERIWWWCYSLVLVSRTKG